MQGLFFKGKMILDETVLRHLLGKQVQPIAIWEKQKFHNYATKHIGDRVWEWTNLSNGRTIFTGDEGNGWCVELANGATREEALRKFLNRQSRTSSWRGTVSE